MTVVFSAVLNNVTAMLIVGSLTVVSLEKLGRREKLLAFLLIEGLLTNIGGLLTLISSVPNIIIGNAAGIGFVQFFLVASPYVVVATLVTIVLGARLMGIRRLQDEAEQQRARRLVEGFDENDGIASRGFFVFSSVAFLAFIGVLATTSIIPYLKQLQMGYVALFFATVMLLRYRSEVDKFYNKLDWDLLLFFASLFVVINVMEHAKVLALIGSGLGVVIGLGDSLGSGALLVSSAMASAVTDNIPLSAVLAKILGSFPSPPQQGIWWAVVFGCNLGGNVTPIGSASTVVAVTIMHKHGLRMSFAQFVKMALPYAAIQLALATLYVVIFL
jgi:Na+/H+ antiporter NhaD/arsenite permease-like protein